MQNQVRALTVMSGATHATLSQLIWGLDWASLPPIVLDDGVRMAAASIEASLEFMGDHYGAIFGDGADRFVTEPLTAAKRAFLERSDAFLFWHDGTPVGLLIGNPVDWSTYYWRTVAFLPAYRGRGLLAAALEETDRRLAAHGVARVEGETAPNNYAQLRLLLRLGYVVTGSTESDRFGSMLRLTKFLTPGPRETFERQFCRGAPMSRDSRSP